MCGHWTNRVGSVVHPGAHVSAFNWGTPPVTVIVVGSGLWRQPWRSLLPLVVTIAAVLASPGLYYREHLC